MPARASLAEASEAKHTAMPQMKARAATDRPCAVRGPSGDPAGSRRSRSHIALLIISYAPAVHGHALALNQDKVRSFQSKRSVGPKQGARPGRVKAVR